MSYIVKYFEKPVIVSFFFLVFLIIYSIIGSRIIDAGNDYQNQLANETFKSMFWLFLFGSLVETFFFNLLLWFFLIKQKLIHLKISNIIILCSIFFGLAHFSSLKFLVITTIVGIIFNINFYIFLKIYKSYGIAFLATFLLHFFSNFFTYVVNDYILPK